MNENISAEKNKRREWVKTAAIIFLAVMLVLTFFSNTIMNYSLPEVAAQYVEAGSIVAKIRGNGVVESDDPYNVMITQTRKVRSVAVKAGDQVQAGDVLLYLEDTESPELEGALDALEAAQQAYELALMDVEQSVISNAQSGVGTNTYRNKINAAQKEVDAAQKEVDAWQDKYDQATVQLTLAQVSSGPDTSKEKEAVNNADKALKAVQATLEAKNTKKAYMESFLKEDDATGGFLAELKQEFQGLTAAVWETYGVAGLTDNAVDAGGAAVVTDSEVVAKINTMITTLNQEIVAAQGSVNNAQTTYANAKNALDAKIASGDNSLAVAQLAQQQALMKVNLDAVTATLAEKKAALEKLTANIKSAINLETLMKAVEEAQADVDEELEKTTDAVVKAQVAGTVTQINATAGKEVSAAEPVAVIQPEGKGYTMSFSVTNDQARRLSVGDKAELVNAWYYDEMDITLTGIKPDSTNPGQSKLLIFEVQGDVTAGQNLNVSVGQKSADYDLIVPNSAIREDNNGKFVLIVESKSSPLGNRYVATRVDVEVLAQSDTKSAISGALYGYEFVITTSTKPVEAGQLIRLAEN